MSDDLVKRLREAFVDLDDLNDAADRIEELESKLAKAVEVALEECPFVWGTERYNDWWHHRRTTLAELTGQT